MICKLELCQNDDDDDDDDDDLAPPWRECNSLRDYLPKTKNFMGLVLFFLDLKQKGNWIDLALFEGFGF
jgi:hypothetical protein